MSRPKSLNPSPVIAGSMDLTSKSETVDSHLNFCVVNAHSVIGLPRNSQFLSELHRNKVCQRCFLFRSLEFCKSCHKCPNCCFRSSCRGQITPVLGKMGSPGDKSQGGNSSQRGLHPPLLVQTQFDQVTNCQPPQKLHLLEALHQLVNKNTVKPVATQKSLGFYNDIFLVPKPTRTHTSTYQFTVSPGSTCVFTSRVGLPVQSTTFWPVHSIHGVHSGGKRGQN